MSEYWISQPRKFCEFCKCWIADNKPSRDFHEKGKRHQENVKKKIEDVKKKGTAKAAKEKEMDDSLREMEENALKAFKKDLMDNPALRAQYGVKLKEKKEEEIVYTVANRPEGMEEEEEEEDQTEESNETTTTTTTTTTTSATSPVGTWYTAQSPAGYTYYWNDSTGEVSWVPPSAYLAQQEEATMPESQEHEAVQEATPEKEDDKFEEPQIKKIKLDRPASPPTQPKSSETPEPPGTQVLLSEIPLPGDIPLPPEKNKEKEEESDEKEESEEEEESTDAKETRRPKSHQSYGSWETVQEPVAEEVDYQLPSGAPAILPVEPVIPTHEPKMKFREKKVTSLGAGPVFFKKRKKTMTAAQFLKKREESS